MDNKELHQEKSAAKQKRKYLQDISDTGSKSKRQKKELSALEGFCLRFPDVANSILTEVDNQSLVKFNIASLELCTFLQKQRLLWIRKLDKYEKCQKEFSLCWRKLKKKTPFHIIKKLSIATDAFLQTNKSYNLTLSYLHNVKPYHRWFQWSPHHVAANYGLLNLYKYIIKKTGYINPKIKKGSENRGITPLHLAARNGHLEICQLIIENVDDKNPEIPKIGKPRDFNFLIGRSLYSEEHLFHCDTPLHSAALSGHYDVCKLILENADNKNPANCFGITPLHFSVVMGHMKICRLIVPYVNNLNHREGDDSVTVLHVAASCGNLKICKLLVKNGADVNCRSLDGKTPLHYAVIRGSNWKICKFLIEKGAYENPQDFNGVTPMHIHAFLFNRTESLELYRRLLKICGDKNPADNRGRTPLHEAAYYGHFDLCKLILENVLNKNPLDNEGKTPFHYAAERDNVKICKLMMASLDDKNPADNRGMTPFHYAAKNGSLKVCKLMIPILKDKNITNLRGETALHLSTHALGGNREIDGEIYYHYGNLDVCKFLIKNGVENTRDLRGKTPLDYARKMKMFRYYKFLRENGTNKKPETR